MGNRSVVSFASRVERLLDRVTYKRIETAADLQPILHVRYLAYLKEGAITRSPDERLVDAFDHLQNAHNFGVYIDGELASAVRIHVLRKTDDISPAVETFRDELLPVLEAGETIIDPNRFVAHPKIARLHPELPFITIRPAYLASAYFNASKVTMTCRAEHQAFYIRHIYAKPVCPPRPYPLLSKPISLMLVDFARDYQRILDRNPYWQSSAAERLAMFGTPKTGQRSGVRSYEGNPALTHRETENRPTPISRRVAVGE
jgi:hypothetical protein